MKHPIPERQTRKVLGILPHPAEVHNFIKLDLGDGAKLCGATPDSSEHGAGKVGADEEAEDALSLLYPANTFDGRSCPHTLLAVGGQFRQRLVAVVTLQRPSGKHRHTQRPKANSKAASADPDCPPIALPSARDAVDLSQPIAFVVSTGSSNSVTSFLYGVSIR